MRKLELLKFREKVFAIGLIISIMIIAYNCMFSANKLFSITAVSSSLVFSIMLIKSFVSRLDRLNNLSASVDSGILPELDAQNDNGKISNHLRSLYFKTQEIVEFVQSIGNKKFDFKYIDPQGHIGKTLSELSLRQQEYAEEERRRNWKNEGLAKFSEFLRTDDKDIKELSFVLLSNLVKYVGANQGGFFIEKEENEKRFMELTACYAYDRKKFVENKVEAGQGLLGQVMLEKEIIYLTDIPKDFVSITSGLGEATPNNIVIIPLIINDNFYGALELASFKILEPYQMEFLSEVAENIASTVSTFKINTHTHELLNQAQDMAQELQSREEEMRQNMEELQSTQEEMERGKVELDGIFGALNNSQGLIEYGVDGSIIIANERLQNIVGYTLDELRKIPDLFLPADNKSKFWSDLKAGNNVELELNIPGKSGKMIWFNANYSPVLDSEGNFKKLLGLLLNITTRKEKEKEFERLSLVANNTTNSVIITDGDGKVEYVNAGFTKLTKYTLEEMLGKSPGRILQGPNTDSETIVRISEKIKNGEPLYEEILNYDKHGEEYWISIAINPVFDAQGGIYKYISVQANITETKIAALEYKYKLEAIDKSNAVIEFDLEGTILSANDNFLKIVDYSREEIIGKNHNIFIPEDEAKSIDYEQFWNTLRRGEFINKEFKRIDKSNNEIWLRGIYNPLLDINGKPVKIIKFAIDITKEKQLNFQTEKQRKDLESHLETINKTIATIEFDATAHITGANDIFLDVSGYTKEDLLGQSYDKLLTEEERTKPQNDMMWSSLMEGNYFTGQFRQKAKNEGDLWLLGTFNPVLDDSGKVESIKMFAQFNTLEKEKEISNAKILGIYNSVVPVIELNSDGICTKANEYFHSEFGLSRLELRNKQVSDIFETDFSSEHFNQIVRKLKIGQVIEELVSFVSDDGNIKIFRAIFNPIKGRNNELSRVLLVLIDKEMIVKISNS